MILKTYEINNLALLALIIPNSNYIKNSIKVLFIKAFVEISETMINAINAFLRGNLLA